MMDAVQWKAVRALRLSSQRATVSRDAYVRRECGESGGVRSCVRCPLSPRERSRDAPPVSKDGRACRVPWDKTHGFTVRVFLIEIELSKQNTNIVL
jgi:hypothetical protein